MNASAIIIALCALTACGAAVTPALIQCKLDALKFLPKDPQMFTPYDGVDLITRLEACHSLPDAGAP